jgi:hypothetical protein
VFAVSDHSVKSVAIVLQILCGKLSRFATVFSRIAALQSLHLRTMSAVGGDTSKGILLPFFYGEPNKFKGWWMRFKSYATIKKFSQAIQRVAEKDLPADEATYVSSDQTQTAVTGI